nr:hypothetical protein [Tanacetum cinerariifolium]
MPRVTQVSIAGTLSTKQPPLKDKSMWSDQEKKIQKIDRLARSLLIQGLLNGIYSLIQSNKTDKDLWDALARHMLGSEYGEQDSDVNDAMKSKNKAVMITFDPLALVAEQTKVSKRKEKVVVSSEFEGSDDEMKKITVFLAKTFNRKKFYSKPTNNNLRTSSATSSANKKQEYTKYDDKKEEKKVDEKKKGMSKVKCYNYKDEQVLLAEDHAWMESSIDLDPEINANMVFMAQIEKVLLDSEASSSSSDDKIANVSYYISKFENHNESDVTHNDSKDVAKLINQMIKEFDKKITKYQKRIEKANQQSKDFENQTKFLQEKCGVLQNQTNTFEKRYEYMIRYSAYFDNDKQHRKQIVDQEILFDKMSCQLVELDENTIHMIISSKDKMYNDQNGIGFENLSYFCKAKDFRPTLYDKRVIGLGYMSRFLIHSDEALEIKKFKRARENKIEFAYDYGSLNASYVNEKIKFSDDYFQEIINPYFEKINSPFQQTSSLKPYVPTVILEKIIIDLEDEVVSLLNKQKKNLKIIESLKSKGCGSRENEISESKNQNENDCQEIKKECDNSKNSNVIAPGMFKLSMSQCVSPISVTKTSCASISVE